MQAFDPNLICSSHLPPATNMTSMFDMLAAASSADPFVGPDQQALEQLLASFEPAPAEPDR